NGVGGLNGPPWILGPSVTLTTKSPAISFNLNGFLVAANVQTVLTDIAPSGIYSVPSGKNLYIMRLGTDPTCGAGTNGSPYAVGPYRLTVNGIDIAQDITISNQYVGPTVGAWGNIISGGQTITNVGACTTTLDGYFLPQ